MPTIEASVEIRATPAEVFAFAQDPARRPAWDERVVRATLVGADRPGRGVRLLVDSRAFGRATFRVELEYTAYAPPDRSAVRIVRVAGPTLVAGGGGAWSVDAVPGGARFETRFAYEVRGGAFGRLVDRAWLRAWLARLTRRSLANLKRAIEGETRGEPSS